MERPWLSQYYQHIPPEISIRHQSIAGMLDDIFKKFHDHPAFMCMGRTLTYGEIETYSNAFSSYLLNNLNLKKGDRVAIMMPNVLQYPIALFGVLRAGMVVVNVNPLYTPRELEHQLKDSGTESILILENFAHVLAEVLPKTKIKNIITTEIGDLLGFPKSLAVNFAVKHLKRMVPKFHLPKSIPLNTALELGAHATDPFQKVEKIGLNDLAFLQYTGGTTGVSKGAMLSHSNILHNIEQAYQWVKSIAIEGQEVMITPLPLYHIFSLTANCLSYANYGCLNVLITNPRDIPGLIKTLRSVPFTAITGVNTLFNALLNHKDFKDVDFKNMRLTFGGGMAVQKSVADRWQKVTGVYMTQGYGLTETSPICSINLVPTKFYNGSIGLPVSSTSISIRDDFGKEVPQGQDGEICIKGPQVMLGYWKQPEETKKVLKNGWLYTGDIGVMDKEGYFSVIDRKKDMILVSGFNVYPNEVEEVLALHPKIMESAAIGVEDEKSGEVVKVFIVKKEENLTESEVLEFCKKNLTGYKVPKHVVFQKELPKTNVGKILRRALKKVS